MRHEPRSTSRQNETREREVNRNRRSDDRRRAVAEAVVYLRSRRIEVAEDEASDAIIRLLAAVGAFEQAVHDRGGALMIDGSPSRRAAKTRFMLPARRDDETILEFAARVQDLAKRVGSEHG